MRKYFRVICLALIFVISMQIMPCASKTSAAKKKTYKSKRNISLSGGFLINQYHYTLDTHKQLGGYHFRYKLPKSFYRTEGASFSSVIYTPEKKVLYKGDTKGIRILTKYGNEIFFFEEAYVDTSDEYYLKAVNVKTKKTRKVIKKKMTVFKHDPIIYKDKIYYKCYGGWYGEHHETPGGRLCVADLQGKHLKHIKIPKLGGKLILGIAYDKIYYTYGRKKNGVIERCNLDGTGYEIVAENFKLIYKRDWGDAYHHENVSYDNTGWYFIGGNEEPYNDLCKLDFNTGEAEIVKKNIYQFTVGKGKLYYNTEKVFLNGNGKKYRKLYSIDLKTGKKRLISEERIDMFLASGKYLYVNVATKKKDGKEYCFDMSKCKKLDFKKAKWQHDLVFKGKL